MKQKVNILVGRFQPFTMGHYKCVKEAYKETGLKTMVIMIDTPEAKIDKKHPFSTDFLLPLYNIMFKDPYFRYIEGIITVKNANIITISEELDKKGYIIGSWTCGTDRYDSYNKMSVKYKSEANLPDDFKLIEIKRSDEDISATKVRQSLIDNDEATFDKLMPSKQVSLKTRLNTDLFNKLREELKKTYEFDS